MGWCCVKVNVVWWCAKGKGGAVGCKGKKVTGKVSLGKLGIEQDVHVVTREDDPRGFVARNNQACVTGWLRCFVCTIKHEKS